MKIGYPCINRTLHCTSARTFRLASYSKERLVERVASNLDCLEDILRFNVDHGILFFRITSDLVPFASHRVCRYDWAATFRPKMRRIGRFIRQHRIRISIHPDQFTLINSPDRTIFARSVRELAYHARVLDVLGLDTTAKIQIHVGGVYGNKEKSMERFLKRYRKLDEAILRRLVIENDDRCYSLTDCLSISSRCGIPVLFDAFHERINPGGLALTDSLATSGKTWKKRDGLPMVDFSIQETGGRRGKHAEILDLRKFRRFLHQSKPHDFDVMLEIKDKEKSAIRALRSAAGDHRLMGSA